MKLLNRLLFSILLLISVPVFAGEGTLELIDGGKNIRVPLETLRTQAQTEFTIFAPFRGQEVHMKGILLDDLLNKYLARTPKRLKLTAIDGYEITFEDWKSNHWVVVTHENGHPLSLRQHGPLRIVELDLGNKNPRNLRDFNDWIWMLQRIEVLR